MITTTQNKPEKNFLKQWSLLCVIGFAIGGIVGIAAKVGTVLYLGGRLEILQNIPPEVRQTTNDLLGNLLMGIMTGTVTGFFQWSMLRNFLTNAKWWILADIPGTSIGTIIYSLVIPSAGVSNSSLSLIIAIPLIGFFKGFFEWLILRKNYPNSTRWIGARVIIVTVISIFSIGIRASTDFKILGNILVMLSVSVLQGIIFGVITGNTLNDLFTRKSEILATQVQ